MRSLCPTMSPRAGLSASIVTPPPSPPPSTATRDSTDGDDPSVPLYNRFKSASTPSTPPPLSPRPYFPGGRRGRGDGAFSEEWTPGNSRNNSSSGNGTPRGTTVLQPELSGYHVDQDPSGDGVQGGSGTCLGGRQSDESEWEVVDSPGLQASFVALPAKLKKNRRSSAPLPVAPTKPPPKRLFRRGAIGTGWSLLRRSPGGRVSPTTVTGDRRVWSE